MQATDDDDDEHLPCLPQEVILENILTRLPVKTLIVFGSVCKLWYNSIHHDTRFASSHFLHSQNTPHLMFSFFNVYSHENSLFDNYFFFLSEDYDEEGDSKVDRVRHRKSKKKEELVGYCNGLVCLLTWLTHFKSIIEIYHPSRHEKLLIHVPISVGNILCSGFGFDLLSNEYKVVIIFFYEKFQCIVYTLGTNSWRNITCLASTNQILNRTSFWSTAIFCDGALFWWTTRQLKHYLLSFDLHDETFQVIQPPTECVSMLTTTNEIHLMELNGSLCAAPRLEKILQTDENNRIRNFKVHLHILKDRVKQVWIKETLLSSDLSRGPCMCNSNFTHIMSFSGRVLLYWFKGKYIQFYDLHMKHLNVVDLSSEGDKFLERKKLSKAKLPEMDYQLHSHIENLISLQTFLPEGAHRNDGKEVDGWLIKPVKPAGLVYLPKISRKL